MKRVCKVSAFALLLGGLLVAATAPQTYAAAPLPGHDDTAPACRANGSECQQNGQCCSKSCAGNCTRHGQSVYCCN